MVKKRSTSAQEKDENDSSGTRGRVSAKSNGIVKRSSRSSSKLTLSRSMKRGLKSTVESTKNLSQKSIEILGDPKNEERKRKL